MVDGQILEVTKIHVFLTFDP